MKCKLFVLEVPEQPIPFDWYGALGSEPKKPGTVLEGMVVPQGKIWLCPTGGNFQRLEALVAGQRRVFTVNV